MAEALAQTVRPTPIRIVGIEDRFGESGKHEQLLQYFGLTARDIASAVREVMTRKRGTQSETESMARG